MSNLADIIAPNGFTPEQKEYLEGLLAGQQLRALSFREAGPPSLPSTSPPPDLIFEERIKRELHPLDAYSLLVDHAEAQQAPERENVFRFKWHGLFYLAPNADGFMARLRIPGGRIQSYQLRELARIAKQLASGFADITTRANLQLRVFKVNDAPEALRRIQSVGLHTRGAGADNVRNLTASPTAGLDPKELIDVTPYVQQLADYILQHREFYDLPRKFNIAFDGGGAIPVLADTNDIGFQAVRVPEMPSADASAHDTPEVCFRVLLGGVTGHQAFASDAGVLVRPRQLVRVAAAILRVYIAHGNRGDRKKARLKYLIADWGLDKFVQAVEALVGQGLRRYSDGPPPRLGNAGQTSPHLGVHPQKQAGRYYVGVSVPVGRMTSPQMTRLAELSELYGSGELRLTVWQNILIPHVAEGYVETVKKALVKMGLDWQASPLRGGLVACTGNSYCKYASTNTKGHALELAAYLEKKVKLDQPLNIHLTGCPNSCAQHYIGDIGLLGAKVKVSGETFEGYHVFVGGGFGENQALGRKVFSGIAIEQLKPTLEKILAAYLRHRRPQERFRDFTARHDLNSLQIIFSGEQ